MLRDRTFRLGFQPLHVRSYTYKDILQKRVEEEWEMVGKGIGKRIQRGIQKYTSFNGYSRICINGTKSTFNLIKNRIKTKKWKPTRKTNNCSIDTHIKIDEYSELMKLIKPEYLQRMLGRNKMTFAEVWGIVKCTTICPVFLCYEEKRKEIVVFFTYRTVYQGRELSRKVSFKLGKRKSDMEIN